MIPDAATGVMPAPWEADQRLNEEAIRLVRWFAERRAPGTDRVQLEHLDAVLRTWDRSVIDDALRLAVGFGYLEVVEGAVRLRHRAWDIPHDAETAPA
ncbi:hypothetical protein [Agromyces mariniharenae]|uniref:Uncharacterized protein n=1 Tax=Agromyces mariniharenae TaxID=2604423 RepID=A0A5S4UW60_9MICO|nr:hypothetical protein [Agromyces mariniharenae]TYL50408.1 hypothetical protein FYC51_14470 [Agromyces mariniharenae]